MDNSIIPKIVPLPVRMAGLPRDKRGFLVPKFVARLKGEWDFRVVEPGWLAHCLRYKTCWLCGQPLGRNLAFVTGPMCVVNRANGEPPCHLECARYAVQVCPFMTKPRMRRNEKGLDEIDGGFHEQGLGRNPGVAAIYVTTSYQWLKERVCRMGPPHHVEWWCEGHEATRAEVENSINSGIPLLRAAEEGPGAQRALEQMLDRTWELLPAA